MKPACNGAGVLPTDATLLARDFGLLSPQQITVLVSLPLPDPLERLMRVFRVMNQVYGFLLKNHIQVRGLATCKIVYAVAAGYQFVLSLMNKHLMIGLLPNMFEMLSQC